MTTHRPASSFLNIAICDIQTQVPPSPGLVLDACICGREGEPTHKEIPKKNIQIQNSKIWKRSCLSRSHAEYKSDRSLFSACHCLDLEMFLIQVNGLCSMKNMPSSRLCTFAKGIVYKAKARDDFNQYHRLLTGSSAWFLMESSSEAASASLIPSFSKNSKARLAFSGSTGSRRLLLLG